jgi:hypothetical protein
MKQKWYTVILRRPDYITTDPDDTFFTYLQASNPESALEEARNEAGEADECSYTEDYLCLAMVSGKHKDLNPER